MKSIFLVFILAVIEYSRGVEICCGDAGCFDDNPPFSSMPLPDCPSDLIPLDYTMYTRTNRNDGQIASETEVPPAFEAARRTVFIAHGWTDHGGSSWIHEMKDAFLDREDINVVIVNWAGGAQIINYPKAASNTRAVGAQTGLIIRRLLTVPGSAASRMWCVGHSLGSHVCGHTGNRLLPVNIRLGRATGMDPAGPQFETNPDMAVGINRNSADFVDILHTDARGTGALGTLRDIGHIDHYPQGGAGMPGCLVKDRFRINSPDSWNDETIDQYDFCSHVRAFQFMTESVKSDCFRTTHMCDNYNDMPESCTPCSCGNFPCGYMGYSAESSCIRSGLHYLTVAADPPYCVDQA